MWSTVVASLCLLAHAAALNDRPIIGILSQEPTENIDILFPYHASYIAASYVKTLESSGARVVPIWINQTRDYYKYIVDNVNGVLIPGGGAPFNATDGYASAGSELYQLAKEKNNIGQFFPVWGTCLGFELLAVLSAGGEDIRRKCEILNVAMPLVFRPDYRKSELYGDVPKEIQTALEKENLTFNYHHWCITEVDLQNAGVADQWKILSTNTYNGEEFVSSFEHKQYPFYGVQFHPEKNIFEWKKDTIPHSASAVEVGQFYSNFFVNQARKNKNFFRSIEEEREALIYGYTPVNTGDKIALEQCYFFTDEDQEYKTTTTTTTTTTRPTTTTTTTTTTVRPIEVTRTTTSHESTLVTPATSEQRRSSSAIQEVASVFTLCLTILMPWIVAPVQ